jgi:hypothetical protein
METNAALNTANNAMKKLTVAANAQVNAEAGRNVSGNLAKSNQNFNAAATGFKNTANKLKNLNLITEAAEFNKAAAAAATAAAVLAARHAKNGLMGLEKKMRNNANAINAGKMPQNAAGLA